MQQGLNKHVFARPSPFARRLFWHVLSLGRGRRRQPELHVSSDKAGGVLLWHGGGPTGLLTIGTQRFALEPGPHFWLFGLRQSRILAPSAGQTLTTQGIRFSGPTLDAWFEALNTARHPEFRLSESAATDIYGIQRQLERLVTKRPPRWEWQVHLTLTRLLEIFFAARELITISQKDLPTEVTRALNAVAADPFRDWRARELAQEAGLGYSAFRSRCRRHLGESIHEYLQRTRLQLAQVLLADPRLQIKEVAERLHFRSDEYFSHFFRQRTGMTPTEYRAHIGNRRAD